MSEQPAADLAMEEDNTLLAVEQPLRARRRVAPHLPETAPPAERLFAQPQEFDFFQAIRLLEQLQPLRREIGLCSSPDDEIVRFRAALGTAFPASSIADLKSTNDETQPPEMTVAFLGLTGPSGVLPAHYSELLLRIQRDYRTPEKQSIAAWFDLFNHRLISLFYRAWEKYRPWVAYQRGDYQRSTPDVFTEGLLSVAGLASAPPRDESGLSPSYRLPRALLRYSGLLAQRPRNAVNLQAILRDFFAMPFEVLQFQGQWHTLDSHQQTQLGLQGTLGDDAVVGTRMWDRQSKVRIRIGPLSLPQFECLLPESTQHEANVPNLGEVAAVVRCYLGAEIDFDLQLVIAQDAVPLSSLADETSATSRLGWNTWLPGECAPHDRDDATFASALSL